MNATASPSAWRPLSGWRRHTAPIATTNTGISAEITTAADADVSETPRVCATCPTTIPKTPIPAS